jgi:hypothetical protein
MITAIITVIRRRARNFSMIRITPIIKAIAASCAAVCCLCSGNQLAGNSSQTGNNGIVVSVLSQTISGTTAAGAKISVYAQNYRPYASPAGFCDSTTANDSGAFVLPNLPQGYVNVYVRNSTDGATAFLRHIPVSADSLYTYADTLDSLEQPGFISGAATDTSGALLALSYVFVDGSPFYCVTKNNGDFLLGPLPAGSYTLGFYANFTMNTSGIMTPAMTVISETSTATVYPDSISVWHW